MPVHAHHAIQIVVALDGLVAIAGGDGVWQERRGVVVRSDAPHSFDCNGAQGVMVFVDPESSEGAWLSASVEEDVTVIPDSRLETIAPALRGLADGPGEAAEVAPLVRTCVQSLRPGEVPGRSLDPRVARVLDAIRASDDLRITLDQAADIACLSPTRFTHLFRDQVGLPFSRYVLWRKLTRAMVAIGSQGTLAAAAQAADFADSAHLTRTFSQMVGMAPSALMRGDLVEIASPFTASAHGAPGPRHSGPAD